jgi:hypothetical protein
MTRRQKPAPRKKHAGVLMGMRSGVQKVAGSVTSGRGDKADQGDGDGAAAKPKSKVWSMIGNVVSAALIVAAVAIFLRRCGIVHF